MMITHVNCFIKHPTLLKLKLAHIILLYEFLVSCQVLNDLVVFPRSCVLLWLCVLFCLRYILVRNFANGYLFRLERRNFAGFAETILLVSVVDSRLL